MADQHYSFEDLKTLVLPNEHIDVQDSETGETKTVKTVSRAEVAAIVAYMLGLDDEHLEEYYSHHYAQLLQSLRSDKNATIIRYLCSIRTILMNNFLQVDNEMRYNLSNLDRMKYFNREEISQLDKWATLLSPSSRIPLSLLIFAHSSFLPSIRKEMSSKTSMINIAKTKCCIPSRCTCTGSRRNADTSSIRMQNSWMLSMHRTASSL